MSLKMRYLQKIVFLALILALPLGSNAQTPKSPVSRVINVPSTAQIAPSLSGDGRHMIFTTTANLKGELLLHHSTQTSPGKWTQPAPVDVINRSQKINHLGGYSLSYDGKYIFFTSRKTYGIGKYDIWYSEKMGDTWSAPKNLAKPINSASDDGCPSISTDGRTLYFVRCQSMGPKDAEGCVLMVAEKKNAEQWGKPKALPGFINDGNILSPKIMADNQTLIYAKGLGDQIDLYQTRKTDQGWTKPVALDFVNSSKNDRFVSVPARGDIMYYSTMFQGTYDIIKAKIPVQFQPQKVVLLKGQVRDVGDQSPLQAFVQLYDAQSKKLIQFKRTNVKDGSFELYIAGGRIYDFSVVTLAGNYTFYAETKDLTGLATSTRERVQIDLQPVRNQVSFELKALDFENDSTLSELASFELQRLYKLLKKNPDKAIEIAVHREAVEEDTTSVVEFITESGAPEIEVVGDTILTDSSQIEIAPPPPDPTELRAQAIAQYLLKKGVPAHLVEAKGYADEEPIAPNDTDENKMLNRRIEIRFR